VLVALAPPHRNLQSCQVDVLDPKRARLAQAQAASVHHLYEQLHRRGDLRHQRPHRVEQASVDLQDVLVQENDGAERLVLRGRDDLSLDRKMGQKRFDLGSAHVGGMAPTTRTSMVAQECPRSSADRSSPYEASSAFAASPP
jgi:hypothetical protein